MDTLGLVTFLRTYARRINSEEDNEIETFEQTLHRVCTACRTQLSIDFTNDELTDIYNKMFHLKCMVAGRALWQLGTGTVERLGLLSLQNCAFVVVDEDIEPFTWTFDALMLGCGVGFRILPSDLDKLSPVYPLNVTRRDSNDADFIVPDSREGWVKLLKKVLKTAHSPTKHSFTYSLHCLRSKDSPIKTFGGKASGPNVLEEGMQDVCAILNHCKNNRLQTIDALDIMNIIGRIVVSGNVRRCVAAGTKIIVHEEDDDEDREIPIEDAQKGFMIYSKDGIYRRIEKVFDNGRQKVITIVFDHKLGSLQCTANHRIAIYGTKLMKQASELTTSDVLTGLDNEPVTISSIVNSGYDSVKVYDLHISGVTFNEKKYGGLYYANGILVHNSAEIAIGSEHDDDFLVAKRWDLGNVPNYRCYSNNTIICEDVSALPSTFWEGYVGNGEPYGLFNLSLAQSCGRLGETQYPDPNVQGTNPCSEQTLDSYETCCLAELILPHMESKDELFQCAEYMYRINKHILALPCHQKRTEKIVHRNFRMGIGITGYVQASEEQKSWLNDCYLFLRDYDVTYSAKMGYPQSIKLTTVKPSGTLSLVCGVPPGIHPAYSEYYIRRIRFASGSDLVKRLHSMGYMVEYQRNFDGTLDHSTEIVQFPVKVPKGTIVAKDMSAIRQLEIVKRLQTEWSDNSVSVTVYYHLNELNEIKNWLCENFKTSLKSCSFLLHSDHGFDQAPYEEIAADKYEEMMYSLKNQDQFAEILCGATVPNEDESYVNECQNGGCPLK